MEVREIMARDAHIARAAQSVREAAEAMADQDVGSLPVSDQGKLVGTITDRDIVLRAIALGRSPADTQVREIMSEEALYCFEDEDAQEAARHMANLRIRRLPVLNRARRLVGVVALADIARHVEVPDAERMLREFSGEDEGWG